MRFWICAFDASGRRVVAAGDRVYYTDHEGFVLVGEPKPRERKPRLIVEESQIDEFRKIFSPTFGRFGFVEAPDAADIERERLAQHAVKVSSLLHDWPGERRPDNFIEALQQWLRVYEPGTDIPAGAALSFVDPNGSPQLGTMPIGPKPEATPTEPTPETAPTEPKREPSTSPVIEAPSTEKSGPAEVPVEAQRLRADSHKRR